MIVHVVRDERGRVECHGLTAHVRGLARGGAEQPETADIRAHADTLARAGEGSPVARRIEVKATRGDLGRDIHDRRVLVSELRVPPAGLETDLVHDRGIEELVQATRDARRHRHAVDVVRVLGVLSADVHFSGGCACRAGDRLLEDLRGRRGRRAVIVILLEDLIARSCVDSEWRRGLHLHGGEAHEDGGHVEVRADCVTCATDGDGT